MTPEQFGRYTPLELARAARARLKVRWMDRTAAIMPWLALFSGLGMNVTAETLTGPEPE